MRRLFHCIMYVLISTSLFAQEHEGNTTNNRLIGVDLLFPTMSDTDLEFFSDCHLLYPTLVINNVVIRDTAMINSFRNIFQILLEKKIIVKERRISADVARKRGLTDVSKDGALLIKIKKNYYMDLTQIDTLGYHPHLRNKRHRTDAPDKREPGQLDQEL